MADEITFHLTGQVGVANTEIAFVMNKDNIKEIYSIDFDGHGLTQITTHGSICLSPEWSSDGKSITYTCFKKRNPDLYVYNIGRRNFRILSSREGVNGSPSWSPDGQKIALMIRRQDRSRIAVIDAHRGEKIVFLTKGGGNEKE